MPLFFTEPNHGLGIVVDNLLMITIMVVISVKEECMALSGNKSVDSTTGVVSPLLSKVTAVKRINSKELLSEQGRLEIEHETEIYRLTRTKNGKLILTK